MKHCSLEPEATFGVDQFDLDALDRSLDQAAGVLALLQSERDGSLVFQELKNAAEFGHRLRHVLINIADQRKTGREAVRAA